MGGIFSRMKPRIGDPAPLFAAPVAGEEYPEDAILSLADLRGERVVLVFYPKDDTPGCTKQACALRDGWADLKEKARIFGVSIDPVEKHRKFIGKYERTTFVIGADGRIEAILEKVSPDEHLELLNLALE